MEAWQTMFFDAIIMLQFMTGHLSAYSSISVAERNQIWCILRRIDKKNNLAFDENFMENANICFLKLALS